MLPHTAKTLFAPHATKRQLSRRVDAGPFEVAAARRNILLFRDLGLRLDNVEAALAEMHPTAAETVEPPMRVVLFTGHMLDQPGTAAEKARFPHTLEDLKCHPRFTALDGRVPGRQLATRVWNEMGKLRQCGPLRR